jgi:hypothetical protein
MYPRREPHRVFSIRLPTVMVWQVDLAAQAEGRTRSDMIRRIITDRLPVPTTLPPTTGSWVIRRKPAVGPRPPRPARPIPPPPPPVIDSTPEVPDPPSYVPIPTGLDDGHMAS